MATNASVVTGNIQLRKSIVAIRFRQPLTIIGTTVRATATPPVASTREPSVIAGQTTRPTGKSPATALRISFLASLDSLCDLQEFVTRRPREIDGLLRSK